MKQKLILLLCLTLLTTVLPLTTLASEAVPETTSKNSTQYTDTFWDIPWHSTFEEFSAMAIRQKNLDFIPTKYANRYTLAHPETFSFLDEPVRRLDVFFNTDHYYMTTADDPIYDPEEASSATHFSQLYIEFAPQLDNPDLDDHIDQFARLIKALYNQYGDPGLSCFIPNYRPFLEPRNQKANMPMGRFALPVISGVLQSETLLKAIHDPYDFVTARVAFHNRALTFAYCPLEGPETCKIRLYIPSFSNIKDHYYFDDIPYTDFLPRPEDF